MSNTQETAPQPQIAMLRPTLNNLPPVQLPDGYTLRTYQEGDDVAWDIVCGEAFNIEQPMGRFEALMKNDACYSPDRVFFICFDGKPVATASAWYRPEYGMNAGYLHYVAVEKAHLGKRLGYEVSLASMHKMAELGYEAAILRTDDFRIPAIKTYLKLGFVPLLVDENQRERWRDIFNNMGRPELIEEYREILEGPVLEMKK